MKDPEFSASDLKLVGAALAELHAQDGKRCPRQTGADVARTLLAHADTLATLVPTLAVRIDSLAQRLSAVITDTATCNHPIHGDFNATQVLLDGDRAAIIDFDQARQGDPAADLGMFMAKLEAKYVLGTLMAEQVASFKSNLLDGYVAGCGRIGEGHLDVYTATLLLQLATQFPRHCEPDWPQRIEAVVARAEAIFAEAQ